MLTVPFYGTFALRPMHKLCRQLGGEGISQMTILLHKPYLVEMSTREAGGSKILKICPRDLCMAPLYESNLKFINKV